MDEVGAPLQRDCQAIQPELRDDASAERRAPNAA